MNLRFASPLLALVCLFFGVANASDKVRELNWEDLMPPEELEAWLSGEQPMQDLEMMFSDDDPARPPAGVVRELDGQRVKIPGFVVPLESDEGGKMTEFFLVPYFGACIHVPPPPPNQIVYVTLEKAYDLKSMYEPYWIFGTMSTKGFSNTVGASVYTLAADRIKKYE